MNTTENVTTNSATTITIVDAPEVSFAPDDEAGDLLLNFYRALGWNGSDFIDPRKIRTTKEVFDRLYNQIYERCPDPVGVGMFMVNKGPGTEDYILPGKVHLLEGWISPSDPEGSDEDGGNTHAA